MSVVHRINYSIDYWAIHFVRTMYRLRVCPKKLELNRRAAKHWTLHCHRLTKYAVVGYSQHTRYQLWGIFLEKGEQ